MSDREDEPVDLFDAICRLDDLAEWLENDWPDAAATVKQASTELKGYIRIIAQVAAGGEGSRMRHGRISGESERFQRPLSPHHVPRDGGRAAHGYQAFYADYQSCGSGAGGETS